MCFALCQFYLWDLCIWVYLTKLVGLPYRSSVSSTKSFSLYLKYCLIASFCCFSCWPLSQCPVWIMLLIFCAVSALSFFLSKQDMYPLLMKTLPWLVMITWGTFQFHGTFFRYGKTEVGCVGKAVLWMWYCALHTCFAFVFPVSWWIPGSQMHQPYIHLWSPTDHESSSQMVRVWDTVSV